MAETMIRAEDRRSRAKPTTQPSILDSRSFTLDPRLTLSTAVCYGCRVVMQSGLRFNLMRPSRLRRGIAIFFLIFTFTELVFEDMIGPRLCCAVGVEAHVAG